MTMRSTPPRAAGFMAHCAESPGNRAAMTRATGASGGPSATATRRSPTARQIFSTPDTQIIDNSLGLSNGLKGLVHSRQKLLYGFAHSASAVACRACRFESQIRVQILPQRGVLALASVHIRQQEIGGCQIRLAQNGCARAPPRLSRTGLHMQREPKKQMAHC